MRFFSRMMFRVRAALFPGRMEREMEEEMAFHREMEARKLVQRGMEPGEAVRQARRRFGSAPYHKDKARESWGIGMIQHFRIDATHTLRSLRRNPGFAAVAVLTLGLGIGASTAIFSVVDGILLQSLPFPDADRLVAICESRPDDAGTCATASTPNVADWAERSRSFQGIGAFRWWGHILETPDRTESVHSLIATPEFFQVMEYRAAVGRVFRAEDQLEGNRHVAILDHDFWVSWFGSDPGIVGSTITLSGEPYEVIGVMEEGEKPPAIEGEPGADVWLPLHFNPRDNSQRGWRGFYAIGRLAPGATLAAARAELGAIRQGLQEEHPEANANWGLRLTSLQDRIVAGVRTTLLFFLAAVGLVLLITCANIANLLLARMASRDTELGVRTALGADTPRLVGLLLNEGLVLALLGGSAGLFFAWLGTPFFLALAPPGIPRLNEVGMNGSVLAFTLGLAVLATILFGIAPLSRASRISPMLAIRGDRHGKPRALLGGINGILVVAEVALALALLVGAGLLTRSFAAYHRWEPGIDREHLLVVSLTSTTGAYDESDALIGLYRRLDQELLALPGVRAVGRGSAGPLFGGWEPDQVSAGEESPAGGPGRQARWYDISPGYFDALGLPIVRGRGLTPDDGPGAPRVVVVNETLADLLWPGQDPIGRTLRLEMNGAPRQVVGVVPDVPPLDPDTPVEPEMFWPQAQAPRPFTYFLIRTSADPGTIRSQVARRIKDVDPKLQVGTVTDYRELMDRRLVQPRFNMLLTAAFSLVALVLAGVGIYGVVSRSVTARTREIGIRLALGARQTRVVGEVVRGSVALAAAGVGLGLALALILSRFIGSLLHGVAPTDPLTYTAVALGLLGVAALSSLIPATAASRVDPMESLRGE